MTSIERAAEIIAGPNVSQGDTDWFTILDLIRDIVRVMLLGCMPQPEDAHDYLTRRHGPIERLLGADRRRSRAIGRTLRGVYRGDPLKFAETTNKVKLALASGRLTRGMFVDVFGEVSAEIHKQRAKEIARRNGWDNGQS